MYHQGLASALSELWKCERWNGEMASLG